MNARRIPTGFVIAWVCAALAPVLVLALPAASIARVVAGAGVLLWLPGFALLAPLYPRDRDMDTAQRVALSLGFSIVLDILLGLMLHFTSWGVRILPLLAVTTGLSLIAITIAIVIRVFTHEDVSTSGSDADSVPTPVGDSPDRSRNWVSLCLGIAVILLVGGTAASALTREVEQTFTTFYLLGPDATIGGLQTRAFHNGPYAVQVAVKNQEAASTRYRIVARSARGTLWDGRPFTLAPGDTHIEAVSFLMARTGNEELLQYDLLTGEPESAYRNLTTWVFLAPPPSATATPARSTPAPAAPRTP